MRNLSQLGAALDAEFDAVSNRIDEVSRRTDAVAVAVNAVSVAVEQVRDAVKALEVGPSPVPPSPPVLPPVACADPARDYPYWVPGPIRDQAAEWLAVHIGLTESNDRAFVLPGYKGLIWHYALDLTVFTSNTLAQALPDSYFIHNADGSRYVQRIWNDDRWFYDLSSVEVRAYVVGLLSFMAKDYDGLFLDEHTVIDHQNLADVALLLKELKTELGNKFVIVNTSQYSTLPGYVEQVLAAGSFCAELQWTSGAMRGWAMWGWAELIKKVSEGGGISHLLGAIGQPNGIHGDADREYIWRLAGYWLVKGPGVYLDLMSKAAPNDVSFSQWKSCLTYDLGKPLGPMQATDKGKAGNDSFPAIVFNREYENGTVFLRGQDGWNQSAYDYSTAVNIPLSSPLSPLRVDGTKGPAVSTFQLRTADAAIMVK